MNKNKKSIMIYNMLAGMILFTSFMGNINASADDSKLQKILCRINEYENRNILELDPYSTHKKEENAQTGPFGKTFASSEYFILTVDLENNRIHRPYIRAFLGVFQESTLYKILDKSKNTESVNVSVFLEQSYGITKETSKNFSFENNTDVLVATASNSSEMEPKEITIKLEVPKGERHWEGFFEAHSFNEKNEDQNYKLMFYCHKISELERIKKTFGIQDPISGENE